jgi:uncharacterized membrane protein (UPF0127 family)
MFRFPRSVLAVGLGVGMIAANAIAQQFPVMSLNAGIHLVQAEVAASNENRMQGLMFRKSMGQNNGMLFVFPEEGQHCMWMKNTLLPLSVAFMDAKGVIVSIHDMDPQSEVSHCAAAPARFALEMNRGWFRSKGIAAGARIAGTDRAPPPR